MATRYDVSGTEGEFEPGSGERVLRNLVGIRSQEDMDELELGLLGQLYEDLLIHHLPDRTLTTQDLQTWHRRWLGNVYVWAGEFRSVNMSKDGFPFAAAAQIPRLLDEFDRTCLARWTPCHGQTQASLIEAIAITHVELILIHPFREGNGRLSRLLADVMAVQAGCEPLDYSSWESDKSGYIRAIHAGLTGDYAPMQACVAQAIAAGNANLSAPV